MFPLPKKYIMKFLYPFILCLPLLFYSNLSQAQGMALKRANNFYKELNLQAAIEAYNKVLEKSDVSEAKINLADCYRLVSDTENAEYWYGQVVRLPEADPEHWLYYGQMLHRNGKCELAKEWYAKFVEAVPDDVRGHHLEKACDYEEELRTKNQDIYQIKALPFNTAFDDFSPMFYKDGLLFTSEYTTSGPIDRSHSWTGDPFTELFYVPSREIDKDNFEFEYGKPDRFSNRINSKYHDATPFLTNKDKTIYFTRNNIFRGKVEKDDAGIIRLKIFYAESVDEKGEVWGNMKGLEFNSDEYSVAHPCLNAEGDQLYFSSDMPGGFGGMDLYVSSLDGGKWGPPTNLGPQINTEGHEVFPYFHSPTNRLHFASNGHVSLGGLDIFHIEKKSQFDWGEVINMGHPINSISDDFGIIMNDELTFGYLSSDRAGGVGNDDIYSFTRHATTVELLVYDELTKFPIEGASVQISGTEYKLTTGENGRAIVDVKLDECFDFKAMKDEYLENEIKSCTKNLMAGEKIIVEIPLLKPVDPLISGIVRDANTGDPLTKAELNVESECIEEALIIMTNSEGYFQFKPKKDCCFKLAASKKGYLANKNTQQCIDDNNQYDTSFVEIFLQPFIAPKPEPEVVTTTPSTPTTTVPTTTTSPNTSGTIITNTTETYTPSSDVTYTDDTYTTTKTETTLNSFEVGPSGQIDGSITFLLHIYYDFDQAYIREDAKPELNKLYSLLIDNPGLIVEIGSHTDSRGSQNYNSRLSQRRAEAVVRWLREKGISKGRLMAKGYGETINVNRCSNNVPCSEYEHQLNRRTEFRVLGNTDGTVYSKPREDVKVSECQGCPF